MTTADLLASLGLDTAPSAVKPTDAPTVRQSTPATPSSPYALVHDDWSIRRGQDVADTSAFRPVIGQFADRDAIAADCLAAAWDMEPELSPACSDSSRRAYLEQLLASDDFRATHPHTALNELAAEVAAAEYAAGFAKLRKTEEADRAKARREGKPLPTGPSAEFAAEMKAAAAASQAAAQAAEQVEAFQDAQNATGGLGGNGGIEGQMTDLDTMKRRYTAIRSNTQLRRIMELAGRFRLLAQAKQRQKTLHGRDDVIGVTTGNDLERLCPSELSALGDEDLELDALRRYLESSMLQRDYRAVEPQGQGPIVVIVDESGSMCGDPVATAKAFALAMAWIARHQRRHIALVGFSGYCRCNTLVMAPGKWDQDALLDWLSHFWSGGSDRDVPLVELPEIWDSLGCPKGRTDVIQITDAYCDVPDRIAESFNAWKARQHAKFYVLSIGTDASSLHAVADRSWEVSGIGTEETAISELFSI